MQLRFFLTPRGRRAVSLALVVTLWSGLCLPAQTTAARSGATRVMPGTPAAPSATADPGWPRIYSDGQATLAVHQPQVDDWKDFQMLIARSAMEIQPAKGEKKQLAAVHWEARTDTDLTARTVRIGEVRITRFSVPGSSEQESARLQQLAVKLLPKQRDAIALDRVLPYLDPSRMTGRQVKISTEAPPIVVSTKPAVLVMIDGQPMLGPVGDTKLTFVVNTNWDILKDGADYYLLNGRQWLTARALEGPWKAAERLPKQISTIPADENWSEVRTAAPLQKAAQSLPVPWVYMTNKPAELVLLDGEPKLAPVVGDQLSEAANTKSLLFFHAGTKHWYVLLSGRWFKNAQLRGNWEFASDSLPEEFRRIPASHPKAHVLSAVPGTPQAEDAVLLANVPQVAVVQRETAAKEAKAVYVGAPQFQPIAGTALQYAVNTPADVIQAEGRYYLLQQGIWFVGGSAQGPWTLADTVPGEIYRIPPESPKHHTTYVTVVESTSQTVTTAQTAGYLGLTVAVGLGVACWGTGYYYAPYSYWGPMYPYPVYWGYPYHSYGAAAWYNPATGFYGRGGVAYGPYGGYGRSAAYNPVTGTYARRAGAWGPYQAGMATSFYNPRTGAWGSGYRYANPYQGWGEGVVSRGDQWARGGYYYDDRGAVGGIRTSEGGRLVAAGQGDNRGAIGRTSSGDLYVGKNGDIYRRDTSGNWQQHGEGGWSNVNYDSLSQEQKQRVDSARQRAEAARPQTGPNQRPEPGTMPPREPGTMQRPQAGQYTSRPAPGTETMRSLERDSSARTLGNRNHDSWQRGSRAGSFGGGMRGGRRR